MPFLSLSIQKYYQLTFSIIYQLLAETMSDMRNNLVPTNIQELFLPLSCVHLYGTRSSTSQNFYKKKLNIEIQKFNSFWRPGAKLWNFHTYYEIDEIILKMKKAEPIFL